MNGFDGVKLPDDPEDMLARLDAIAAYVRVGAIGAKRDADLVTLIETSLLICTLYDRLAQPIPMLLYCPSCDMQHVDAPQPEKNWTNPPHRSHECQGCRYIWRPCDRFTNGVKRIETAGKHDNPTVTDYFGQSVRVDGFDLALVTQYFGEHNWPDTEVGNAAHRLYDKMMLNARVKG